MSGQFIFLATLLVNFIYPFHANVCLIQTSSSSHNYRNALQESRNQRHPQCAELFNRGTHFTVEVNVGTPAQTFSVVADTGSNHLIVPSCICQESGVCDDSDRCFRGTNRSSTFAVDDEGRRGPPAMLITFGSGQVQAVIATDVASVAGVEATLNKSLLLMVDNALQIPGSFEGILGLGLPQKGRNLTYADAAKEEESGSSPWGGAEGSTGDLGKIIQQIIGQMGGGAAVTDPKTVQTTEIQRMGINPTAPSSGNTGKSTEGNTTSTGADSIPEPKGFLEWAGISRFSMCFKESGNGTLQLGTPEIEDQLQSIGQFHWSLDFQGINIGQDAKPVPLCSKDSMTSEQESACAVIPDSGTTAIMAPKEHLSILYEHICDNWERCSSNYTAFEEAKKAGSAAAKAKYGFDVFGINKVNLTKKDILNFVLQDCGKWLDESNGLDDELPKLNFQIAGKSGKARDLELTGWSYVLEQEQEIGETIYKEFLGQKIPVGINGTGKTEKICTLGFSEVEYTTKTNGPVWILGTPLFYAFKVAYDLDKDKPAISFTSTKESPCESCETALLDSGVKDQTDVKMFKRAPRRIEGPWRKPALDLSLPL